MRIRRSKSAKAVEMGEDDVKEQLQEELESYQQEKPWREKQEVKEKPKPPRANASDLEL